MVERWLGIDFSGNHRMWNPRCSTSNVWIAELEGARENPQLTSLRRVQELPGNGYEHPFGRLASYLAAGNYAVATIDAPFSVPTRRLPSGSQAALLKAVADWNRNTGPFPAASTLVKELAPDKGPKGGKEYRFTETLWRVNVRSTIWAGPRGGAAMTAACLTLLGKAKRPIWPWASRCESGLLAEAFPAAQLRVWGLPHEGYNGQKPTEARTRAEILAGLRCRCGWTERAEGILCASADALDALLCSLAAVAVTKGSLSRSPVESPQAEEGWIAVHA